MLSDDDAKKLSEEFAYLVQGGQPKIVRFRNGKISGVMSIQAFKLLVANRVQSFSELGKAWLNHRKRLTFERSTFDPSNSDPDALNFYEGLAVKPVPGDCEILLQFIREVICNNDEATYRWVLAWLAKLCREPGKKPGTCLVLKGGQGTGKSTFAAILHAIFGAAATTINSPRQLTGNFNAHIAQRIVVIMDEAPVTSAHKNAVKEIITGATLRCEPKGVDAFDVPNNIWLVICTNEDQAIDAQGDERRYCVLQVSSIHKGNTAYFARIHDCIQSGGIAHLLYYLLNYEDSDIDIRVVPETNALVDQKRLSLRPIDRALHEMLLTGRVGHRSWRASIPRDDFVAAINSFRQDYEKPLSAISIGMRLKEIFGDQINHRDGNGARKWNWQLPDLETARAMLARKVGIPDLFEEETEASA